MRSIISYLRKAGEVDPLIREVVCYRVFCQFSIVLDDNNIILEVTDNGKGLMERHLSKPQSFGLIGIRERVYPWAGKVEISGEKNRGTTVKVVMPHPE